MARFRSASSLFLVACLLPLPGFAAQAEREAEVRTAAKKLGSDSYLEREQASYALWKAGRAAIDVLEKAARSADREVAFRASFILRNVRYGILPDTPPEVAGLLFKYRDGDEDVRMGVLAELLGKRQVDLVLQLLRGEEDPEKQRLFVRICLEDLAELIHPLMRKGRMREVEELLLLDAHNEHGLRNYAAWLVLQGHDDDRLKELELKDAQAFGRRFLPYLHRARGEFARAAAAAELAAEKELAFWSRFDLGDWNVLKPYAEAGYFPDADPVQMLAFRATVHRRLGEDAKAAKAEQAIGTIAVRDPGEKWLCTEGLLVAGNFDEALKLMEKGQSRPAFQYHATQLQHARAFTQVALVDPRKDFDRWVGQFLINPNLFDEERTIAFDLLGTLHRLGLKKQTGQLLRRVAERSDHDFARVCWMAMAYGHTELAFELARNAVMQDGNERLLHLMFYTAAAPVWWDIFRGPPREGVPDWAELFDELDPKEKPEDTLRRIHKLIHPVPDPETRAWAERQLVAAAAAAEKLKPGEQLRWWRALAETSLAWRMQERAFDLYRKLSEREPDAGVLTWLGDRAGEQERWDEAAAWYGKAGAEDPSSALYPWLQGWALLQAGKQQAGERLMRLAEWLPLADGEMRSTLAAGLAERNHREAARKQWDLVTRFGETADWYAIKARESLADGLIGRGESVNRVSSAEDCFAAAHLYERVLLESLYSSSIAPSVREYLHLHQLVHEARSRGHLLNGDLDAAVSELQSTQHASPELTNVLELLVPALDAAGKTAQAERLFATAYAPMDRACREYPESALYLNGSAWVSARCGRHLDQALERSRRAVALEPDNPAYLDTLGEVLFRKGQVEEAVKTARRTVELDPDEAFFKEQLARFEAARKP